MTRFRPQRKILKKKEKKKREDAKINFTYLGEFSENQHHFNEGYVVADGVSGLPTSSCVETYSLISWQELA